MPSPEAKESSSGPPHRVAVSGVRSASHVMYLASWVSSALVRFANGVQLVDLDGGRLSRFGALLPWDHAPAFSVSGDTRGVFDTYVTVGAAGIKHWTALSCRRGSPIPVVATDEGLGSYGSTSSRWAALRREGANPAKAGVRLAGGLVARSLPRATQWRLYTPTPQGDWTVDERVADGIRRLAGGSASQRLGRFSTVVYLAQPWVALGVIGLEAHRARLGAIRASVERVGLEMTIRPHPLDQVDIYRGFEIVEGDQPAELDPRVLDAAAVIGETSTALLNLRALFGVQGFRLADAVLAEADATLSSGQRALLATFLGSPIRSADLSARLRGL